MTITLDPYPEPAHLLRALSMKLRGADIEPTPIYDQTRARYPLRAPTHRKEAQR